jgi:hypothetical protein
VREQHNSIYLVDIEVGNPLGSGNFGTVKRNFSFLTFSGVSRSVEFYHRCSSQGKLFPEISLNFQKLKKAADKNFENEFTILLKLNHPK